MTAAPSWPPGGARHNHHVRKCCNTCGMWEVVSPRGFVVIRQPSWSAAIRELINQRKKGLL